MKKRRLTRAIKGVAKTALAFGLVVNAGLWVPATAAPTSDGFKNYPKQPSAPARAPNVLLIMTDDVGFSASTGFGGVIPTPVFDSLALGGLRYNAFHTTAMCSPTRAALLTGRNHHAVESGAISNLATDQLGYTSVIPDSAATIGRVLQLNGYDTAWVGKNHNTPVWETGPTGPFNHWPNAMGFDYFYGFNAAMADQFSPELIENRNPIDPPANDASYNLDRDLAEHLLHWMQVHHTVQPGRPFFAYWAPGTLHSPHQVSADWIARFKGQFAMGWDKLREQTFERQKRLGIVPANAVLTPRPAAMPAWDSLSSEEQAAASRMMEVAAAQLAQSDYQIGRVIDWLKESGQFDNTLIIFLHGDNGASDESINGANNELASLNGIEPTYKEVERNIQDHGGPFAFGNYPAPWAWATNTPFQWGKEVASHLGGLRDALAISWPARIKSSGLRTQFGHVIDIAPTIYEAVGIKAPLAVDGVKQQPMDGVSLVYTFNDAAAPSRHTEQYFEMLGNRSYYSNGWLASTTPEVAPWERHHAPVDPNKFHWELYDLNNDYSQANDVSAQYPAKLAELKKKFDKAAVRNHVYPLGADLMTRFAPSNRPDLLAGRDHLTYYPGDTRYPANSFPGVRQGWSATAHVTVGSSAARGPLLIAGDLFGGYGLSLENGFPVFLYNPTGREQEREELSGKAALQPGLHDITVSFAANPAGGAQAATLTLSVDGKAVDSRSLAKLYRVFGNAYVGRAGLTELMPGARKGALADATLRSIDIDLKK
ncbi:arylsulfatase [Novosphingobium sp. 1529]|uniref:arylsulfatase n=1 Tax=Novosphingobium sp. 1529 TaxID=3156424 RepID=UPI00145B90E7